MEFLGLKRVCTGWYGSTLVKMPHCWKSHVTAHLLFEIRNLYQSIAIIISTLCDTDLKCPFNRDNLDHKDPFNLLSHDTYFTKGCKVKYICTEKNLHISI